MRYLAFSKMFSCHVTKDAPGTDLVSVIHN